MTPSRSSGSASYRRPAFWKVPSYVHEIYSQSTPTVAALPPPCRLTPQRRRSSTSGLKKRVHFADEPNIWVQAGSPSQGELLRGDIIAKIGEYDARDLSHADAQQLFRGAGNEIRLVVHRDNKIAYTQGVSQEAAGPGSRSNSTLPPASPELLPHRGPSPFLPGPSHLERALQLPVDSLPHTVFPQLNASGGYVTPSEVFSPKPTRDHQQDVEEEQAAIVNQPYRTTPLVLPGAKVKKDAPSTDSYLRHYPNPAVRAHPGHDYHDSIMKQRVADTMLHKVVGSEADTGRVFHKQFNSPIGLYSNSNIEDTIRTTVPFATSDSYRLKDSPLHRPLPTKLNGNRYQPQYPVRRTMW
ncbi:uncharacterized protein LOC111067752 isoform X5 [Drosophila obscura]|uniref:uncharacterized protein LOC111067752 isoform X5 n=1 Tax=Drosophila obscura TaxID=7282 RepID=UPI000BA03C45|nr:uncharacterized protein LOC111067752 isoform X5 [Drosophila obscura]